MNYEKFIDPEDYILDKMSVFNRNKKKCRNCIHFNPDELNCKAIEVIPTPIFNGEEQHTKPLSWQNSDLTATGNPLVAIL